MLVRLSELLLIDPAVRRGYLGAQRGGDKRERR